MRYRKYLIITLLAIALTQQACRPPASGTVSASSALVVTDFRGRTITLDKPATRIICLIESALSGIYMLHAGDHVTGVSTSVYDASVYSWYAVLDDRIKNRTIPAPGNWDFVSIENIVALKPDLVIIWASQSEPIRAIEEHGIPVYGVFLMSFEDVYKEIADLGTLTGTVQRADSLIQYTRSAIESIRSRLQASTDRKKSVYFMWPQGLLETAGVTSTVNELIELAGARNCCTVAQEHTVVNKEKLLEWNPDIWLMWYNTDMEPDDIQGLQEFRNTNALRNGHVYELPSPFLCDLWTLKFPYAAGLLASWCYPASFSGFDPEAEKYEMLHFLYGIKKD